MTCRPPRPAGAMHAGACLLATTALTLLAPVPPAAADPATALDAELPELVVTANRVETPVDKVGSALSVVTSQDIERQQIRRPEDALRRVPGVTVTRQGSLGRPTAVNLRGLGFRNTLVLIDGVEVNDPSRAQVIYEFGTLPTQDIERIEVLRGPQSSLYGSDATGGVINIITKRAETPFEAEAALEYGSYNTIEASGAVRGRTDRFDYTASLFGHSTGGFSSFNERRGGQEDDGHQTIAAAATAGVELTDHWRAELSLRYSFANNQTDRNDQDLIDTFFEKEERFGRLATTLDTFGGAWQHTVSVARTEHTRDFFGGSNDGDQYDGFKTRLDYLGNVTLDDTVTLVVSAEYERAALDQRAPNITGNVATGTVEEAAVTNAVAAELQVQPLDGWVFSLAGRGDHHEDFGSAFTYRVTSAYTLATTDTKLRGSVGTGFVAPSLYELHDPCIGTPDLGPETSFGWDIGVDQSMLGDRVRASLTYFATEIDDQINFAFPRTNPAGCTISGGYVNIDQVSSRGIEAELSAALWDGVTASVAYTYTVAEDLNTDTLLRRIPRHQATIAADWQVVEDANLSLTVLYRGDTRSGYSAAGEPVASYWLTNLGASYDVTDAVTVHARVENLFDQDYEEDFGFGTAGISGYGGIRVRF